MLKNLLNSLLSKLTRKEVVRNYTTFNEQTKLEDTFILKKTTPSAIKKTTKPKPVQKNKKTI